MTKGMDVVLGGLIVCLVFAICMGRLSYYLLPSAVVTFVYFGLDKHLATKGKDRVPERFLWILAATGGAVAAIIAMHFFHHKICKPKFYLPVYGFLIAQLLGLGWLLFL